MKRLLAASVFVALCFHSAGHVSAQDGARKTPAISLSRARAIALAKVPGNEGVTSSKLKHKNGFDVYEFDIETAGPGHQEVRIDAQSGAVVSSTHEDDIIGKAGQKIEKAADKVFAKDEIARMKPAISEQRARAIAQQRFPNAPVKDVDLETKHGILVWEVDVDTAGAGHEELLIDAATGDVVRSRHRDDFLSRNLDKIRK